MEMILFDENFREIGPTKINLDMEIGENATNDFSTDQKTNIGHGFYVPGTEIGGLFEEKDSVSWISDETARGFSWRGLLTQSIIEPAAGEDYKTVSGELNSIIRSITAPILGGLFSVSSSSTGVSVSNFQFNRYCNVLEGLSALLRSKGYRLNIEAVKDSVEKKVIPVLSAVPAVTIDGAFDSDSGLKLRFKQSKMGINHLICLGKGDLKDRQRIDLYVQADGSIGKTKYYTGLEERTAVFDYSSAESLQDLETQGIKRLEELKSKNTLSIEKAPENLWIGDKVRGVHREAGIDITANVTKIIIRVSNGIASFETKTEEL